MSVTEVTIVNGTGSSDLVVDASRKIRIKILVNLSDDIGNIKIFSGIRGFAKALRLDLGSELSNKTHLLCSHNQLIHDSLAPGTGGGLFKGQHSFEMTFDLNAIREKGVTDLPPTCSVILGDALFKVKYMMKVLVKWTGRYYGSYSKEALAEFIVHESEQDRAWRLCNPFPMTIGNFGAPGTPRQTLYGSLSSKSKKWSSASEHVQCVVTIPRRAVLMGDTIHLTVSARPAPGRIVTQAVVKVIEILEWPTQNYGTIGNNNRPCVLAWAMDENFGNHTSLSSPLSPQLQSKQSAKGSFTRETIPGWPHSASFHLEIPPRLMQSIDVGSIKHRFNIQVSVYVQGQNEPAVLMEAPLAIIPRGNDFQLDSHAIPKFSIGDKTVDGQVDIYHYEPVFGKLKHLDTRQMIGNRFEAVYPFHSSHKQELDLQVGDRVEILSTFENGYANVMRIQDQTEGWVPLHYLIEVQTRQSSSVTPSGSLAASLANLTISTTYKSSLNDAPLSGGWSPVMKELPLSINVKSLDRSPIAAPLSAPLPNETSTLRQLCRHELRYDLMIRNRLNDFSSFGEIQAPPSVCHLKQFKPSGKRAEPLYICEECKKQRAHQIPLPG